MNSNKDFDNSKMDSTKMMENNGHTFCQDKGLQDLNITGSWLTVNRACNLRCKWCYAEGTEYNVYDDMSLQLAKKLVDFQSKLGIKNVILIGGEPTLWQHLFEIIELISKKGMKSSLVTNGILLADEKYLAKLKASSIGSINISLKSGNKEQHKQITGSSEFNKVIKAIRNTSKLDIPVNFSLTINNLILDNIDEIVKIAADNGAKSMILEFCTTTFQNMIPQRGYMPDYNQIVKIIEEKYDEMNKIINGNLALSSSIPTCLWSKDFIAMLEKEGKISYGCQVKSKDGLIFDTNGNILVCNCLCDFPIGKFGEDFNDTNSFVDFWFNKEVVEIYDKIISYPSTKCIDCKKYFLCGGGCPLIWFVNDPNKLII